MIVSEKRLLANRQNSLKAKGKSTGPKDCSNTKNNALRHGLAALKPIMLPGEDEEEFNRLCESVRNMLRSKEGMDDTMAERIAFCLWRLRRVAVAEGEIIRSYAKSDGIDWQGLLNSGYLGKINRYERRIMSYMNKLFREFINCLRIEDLSK